MLDVSRLRVFRAVVNVGSVHAAATNLGYSPSAVSQHITALQRETGLALFEKSGRGIVPTALGEALASASDEVMTSLGRLDSLVDDLREGRTRTLSIGTFASAGQYWVPRVAGELLAEYPDLALNLDLRDDIAGQQATHDLELRTEDPDEPPTAARGYHRVPLIDETYRLVMRDAHRLAQAETLALADTAGERFIIEGPMDSTCAQVQRRTWTAAGLEPRYIAQTGDHHSAIALVASGVGLTLIPRLAMGTLPPGLVDRSIDRGPAPRRRICVFVRRESSRHAAVTRAVELLQEIAKGATDVVDADAPA
ncbi:MAG: LysR family transcriptional regulator [Nostocoides sp.]